MAYSKTSLLFLGLVFAVMLVISSHVAEATQTQESVEEAKHHEHGHRKGHGYGHGKGHGKGHGHGKPGHGGHPGHGAGETESYEN
ncbi:uncharacterized protein LOC132312212 [Cornus florida]|uniref:uncharacterized protein LOC132312212 n=1 Tax=Cornus florida TaxID=4283 RepID=UPI00289AA0B0|nr:uncharacterized protein LOC132312212 [Cornus florida]